MSIKQVIRELPKNELTTPQLMAAIWEKVPDVEPEDIATALRQVAEEYNAEGDELRRYVRMRNQTRKEA